MADSDIKADDFEINKGESLIILISGSNRGLGLGFVKSLSSKHKVIAGCRNPDKAEELKALEVDVVKFDITKEEDINAAYQYVLNKYGHIDMLINNAGVGTKNHPNDKISVVDLEELQWVFQVNAVGTFRVTRTFLPLLHKSRVIPRAVMLSSDLGSITKNKPGHVQGAGDKTCYRMSKAAVNMMTRCFAAEYPKISFLCLTPGWVATDMGSSGGRKPPLTVDQSVSGMLKVIHEMDLESSGAFKGYDGNSLEF